MNYGKRNSVKKQKKISSKSKMKKKRAGVRIFKGFLIVFLLYLIIFSQLKIILATRLMVLLLMPMKLEVCLEMLQQRSQVLLANF